MIKLELEQQFEELKKGIQYLNSLLNGVQIVR